MKPIAFYPDLARLLGNIEAAIYYQQLYYWSDKGSREDGFIYKTKDEIEEETTLSRFQQDRCRKQLEENGWLETKLVRANGHPTVHYRCTYKIEVSISKKLANGKVRNLLIEKRETSEYITENTQRIHKAENKFSDSPILVVEEVTTKERKPKDTRAMVLREKLYTMFENSTGIRPTTTVADYIRITEALKHLEEKHIEDMVENALSYGNEKTVREVLTARKIDIYRQENL